MRLGVTGMNDILEGRSLARRETPAVPAERLRPLGFRRADRAPGPTAATPPITDASAAAGAAVAWRGSGLSLPPALRRGVGASQPSRCGSLATSSEFQPPP